MTDLPRDVELRIVRLLDVDSRRALGAYSRLRVPPALSADISRALVRLVPQTRLADATCDSKRVVNLVVPAGNSLSLRGHMLAALRTHCKIGGDVRVRRAARVAERFFFGLGPGEGGAVVAWVPDGPEDERVVAFVDSAESSGWTAEGHPKGWCWPPMVFVAMCAARSLRGA